MVKYIIFREGMSEEYFYCDETLLISAVLPAKRILEIISKCLQGVTKT